MIDRVCTRGLAAILVAASGAAAVAQDSVSSTPGAGDALSPYTDPVTSNYVLDLTEITSSWGNTYAVGPTLKASEDADPMFLTNVAGAAALSPDQRSNVTFGPTDYSLWSSAGAGINASANSMPGTLSVSGYDRQFGLALNDLNADATNVVNAIVGQDSADPTRLYIQRVVGLVSRTTAGGADTATLSIGAIDADGVAHVRADDFNSTDPAAVLGENVLRVVSSLRGGGIAALFNIGGPTNISTDPGALTFVTNAGTTTLNPPAAIPGSLGSALALIFDFAGSYSVDGAAGVTSHLSSGLEHRGNPVFAAQATGAGVGSVVSLARDTGSGNFDAINVFEVDAAGAVLSTDGYALPASISDGTVTLNTAGDASFLQYRNQTAFRGPNGHAAVSVLDGTNTLLAAATATSATDGDFIAVVTDDGTPSWTLAAYVGKPVLDGENGVQVGVVTTGSPVSISAPALDRFGNVYFVAAYLPDGGSDTTGFFKAVNTASGYQLELIASGGQQVLGANSATDYLIDCLTLGDSDSIASGGFSSTSILATNFASVNPSGADDPLAFGGAAINAKIIYDNAGTPEAYQAALFVAPVAGGGSALCPGDVNGDGFTTTADITFAVSNLGAGMAGASGTPGDANGDGLTTTADITFIVSNLGCDASAL